MNDLRMELKVCEGCGALWLRTGIADGTYCRTCRGRLGQLPAARGRHKLLGPRRPMAPVPPAQPQQHAMTAGAR